VENGRLRRLPAFQMGVKHIPRNFKHIPLVYSNIRWHFTLVHSRFLKLRIPLTLVRKRLIHMEIGSFLSWEVLDIQYELVATNDEVIYMFCATLPHPPVFNPLNGVTAQVLTKFSGLCSQLVRRRDLLVEDHRNTVKMFL